MIRCSVTDIRGASAAAFLLLTAGAAEAAIHHRHHHRGTPRAAERPAKDVIVYVVRRGDTLAKIAARLGVPLAELRASNQPRGDRLHPGDRIRVHTHGRVARASGVPREARVVQHVERPRTSGSGELTALLTANQAAELASGRFIWPLAGEPISEFQGAAGGVGNGIMIQSPPGASVQAAAAGNVVYAGGQLPGFGNLVLIKHTNGWITAYGYLGRINVRMMQAVSQGQVIGHARAEPSAAPAQVYFEVRYAAMPQDRAQAVNPRWVLSR